METSTTIDRASLIERFFVLRPLMARRFGSDVYKELRDKFSNITLHQLTVLEQLKEGPLSMSELAKSLCIGESAATAAADRLVRQGLVERQSDPTDRRIVRLALSPSVTNLVEQMHTAATEKTKAFLSVLSDSQLTQLVDIIETLCAGTTASSGPCGPAGPEETMGDCGAVS